MRVSWALKKENSHGVISGEWGDNQNVFPLFLSKKFTQEMFSSVDEWITFIFVWGASSVQHKMSAFSWVFTLCTGVLSKINTLIYVIFKRKDVISKIISSSMYFRISAWRIFIFFGTYRARTCTMFEIPWKACCIDSVEMSKWLIDSTTVTPSMLFLVTDDDGCQTWSFYIAFLQHC